MKTTLSPLAAGMRLATDGGAFAAGHYVQVSRANAIAPYKNWATAAMNIEQAGGFQHGERRHTDGHCLTDPTNPLSAPRLLAPVSEDANRMVTCQSVAGMNYLLERSASRASGREQEPEDAIRGRSGGSVRRLFFVRVVAVGFFWFLDLAVENVDHSVPITCVEQRMGHLDDRGPFAIQFLE